MIQPFKIDPAITKPAQISDTNFKEFYPSINKSMDFSAIIPYIKQASQRYIRKWIGADNTITIAGYSTSAVPAEKELYEALCTALAYYTIYDALPHLNTVISDLGAMENNNDHSNPATKWRYQQTRYESLIKADISLDYLIDLVAASSLTYTWTDTTWFKTTEELAMYTNITNRRGFVSMLPFIRKAESDLEMELCDYYTTVIGFISLPAHTALITACLRLIAEQALVYAIPHLLLYIDGSGIKITSSSEAFDNQTNVLSSFGKDGPDKLITSLKLDVAKALGNLRKILSSNPTLYQAYIDKLPTSNSVHVVVGDELCVGGIGIL